MLYFIVYKNKKDEEYKLFTNFIFDNEKEAEHFGKSSMSKKQEHKVVEYTTDNYRKYWGNVI